MPTPAPPSPSPPPPTLATTWAAALTAAHTTPTPWALPRDCGRVAGMRRPPAAARLGRGEAVAALEAAFSGDGALRALAAGASARNAGVLAAVRAAALLAHHQAAMAAEEDRKGSPRPQPLPPSSTTAAAAAAAWLAAATLDARTAVSRAVDGSLGAAVGTALRGSALERVHDNSAALLAYATAVDALEKLAAGEDAIPPPPSSWTDAVARLSRRVPAPHAAALAAGGPPALAAALAAAAAALAPPILRPRPKYYHYFKWMEGRLVAACGGALPPAPVVDRLLASDAGALDDLLAHGRGAARAVAALTAAFEAGGEAAVMAAPIPRLTWEEMVVVQAARAAAGGGGPGGGGGVAALGGAPPPAVEDGVAFRLLPPPAPLPALVPVPTLAGCAYDAMD